MHFLTSLFVVAGFFFAICLSLVKLSWELSQPSAHESPTILETPGDRARAEQRPAKVIESYEPSRSELSDAR